MAISSYFPSVRPSLSLDFVKSKRLDPRIIFSRAQTGNIASYTDSNGLVRFAGPDEPRFDHDPDTGESLGLLVEEERTNLMNYSYYQGTGSTQTSGTVNNWSLTLGNATLDGGIDAPDGSNDAVRFTNANNGNNAILRLVFPTFAANGTDSYTVSFWVRGVSGSGTLVTDLNDHYPIVTYSDFVDANAGKWARFTATGVPSAANKGFLDLISNVTNSRVVDFWGVQIEKGDYATSFIRTSGTTITRPADSGCLIPSSIFPDLYNTSQGTTVWEGFTFARGISPLTGFRISTGANLRGFGIQIDTRESLDSDSVSVSFRDVSSGFTNFNIIPDDDLFSNYSNIKSSTTWNVNSTAYTSLNGVDKTSTDGGSLSNWPSFIGTEDRLQIGTDKAISGTNNPFNGHIKQFKLYTSNVPLNTNIQLSKV